MQTVLRVKYDELNVDFLHALKVLFKSAGELEIIVNAVSVVSKKETKAEYWARIDKAIADVKKGNVVSMTMEELETYAGK